MHPKAREAIEHLEQADFHVREAAARLSVLPDTTPVMIAHRRSLPLSELIRDLQHDVRAAAAELPKVDDAEAKNSMTGYFMNGHI